VAHINSFGILMDEAQQFPFTAIEIFHRLC
jgi:hypothetical protein